jgi:short-chain fatty acids transporter
MGFSDRFIRFFKTFLPAPFTIAVVLSTLTYFLALFTTKPAEAGWWVYSVNLMNFWESGLWTNSLMVFAVQMMLMLVLGHVLALTKPVSLLIDRMSSYCTNTARAAFIVSMLTIIVALFNWGLGLIFGAIFARKVGEYARNQNLQLNYPLIGACGYVGLMVWHGGLSGSSLIKVAEPGHLGELLAASGSQAMAVPEKIGFDQTVFSGMNIATMFLLLAIVPLAMYLLGKGQKHSSIELPEVHKVELPHIQITGAERLDHSSLLAYFFAAVVIGAAIVKAIQAPFVLAWFTPNNINLLLLGLGLALHGSFFKFLRAIEQAIGGVSGILIQFPLYFGIMGIMNSSGLVQDFSEFFISISNDFSFPIFTFISAGVVNIFVPSGGGQWVVQGPIILEAANALGVSLPKSILALAYGDQLTNMLQPFWALPLLGITGLKAKDILPYTLVLFLLGGIIFLSVLMLA